MFEYGIAYRDFLQQKLSLFPSSNARKIICLLPRTPHEAGCPAVVTLSSARRLLLIGVLRPPRRFLRSLALLLEDIFLRAAVANSTNGPGTRTDVDGRMAPFLTTLCIPSQGRLDLIEDLVLNSSLALEVMGWPDVFD